MNTGVYHIKNNINGHLYIGSAAKSFDIRWKNHLNELRKGKHNNSKLQRAFSKYGEENFSFKILAYLPQDKCLKVEQWYIDIVNPYYNICKVAGSRLGTSHSDESKNKMSEKAKGRVTPTEAKAKISASLKGNKRSAGMKHTEDAKNKMSISRKGKPSHKKGIPLSAETIAKMKKAKIGFKLSEEGRKKLSIALTGKKHSQEEIENQKKSACKFLYVIQNPKGELINTDNLLDFSRKNGLHANAMIHTLKGFDNRGYSCDKHKGYKVISKTIKLK